MSRPDGQSCGNCRLCVLEPFSPTHKATCTLTHDFKKSYTGTNETSWCDHWVEGETTVKQDETKVDDEEYGYDFTPDVHDAYIELLSLKNELETKYLQAARLAAESVVAHPFNNLAVMEIRGHMLTLRSVLDLIAERMDGKPE